MHLEVTTPNPTKAPSWLRDAVIYELNPRTFTSPSGAGTGDGSGTFASLEEKLPYLKELGVNTIWMAGHTQGCRHFSDVWTVYAMVDPRQPDPALGTPQELRQCIQTAHKLGIRVLGEVVTHGITLDSPLRVEHPDWFSGGEWGMADFDYTNPEFRKFWIDLWTKITLDYGFDGWRLDGPNGVSSFMDTLSVWDDIAGACLEAGAHIAIVGENSRYHVRQGDCSNFSHDIAGVFAQEPQYATMQISCHDEGINMGVGDYYALKGSRFKFGYSTIFGCNIPIFLCGEEFSAHPHPLPRTRKQIYNGFETSREIPFYDVTDGGEAGGWLLLSQLDWSECDLPQHREMLKDCKKILAIREANRDILHYDHKNIHILPAMAIPKSGSIPYIRYVPGESAILVVGNETPFDQNFLVHIPLEELGLAGHERYQVHHLITDEIVQLSPHQLVSLSVPVPADYTPGGGVAALRISPND